MLPAGVELEPDARDDAGLGLTPAVQTTVRAPTSSPLERVTHCVGDPLERRADAQLDARLLRSSRAANSDRARRHLRHDLVACLDQHPAHPLRCGNGDTDG